MHLKLILLGCKCKVVRQLSDQIMNKSEFYADLNRDFQALMAGGNAKNFAAEDLGRFLSSGR